MKQTKKTRRCEANTFFWAGTQEHGFRIAEFRCQKSSHDDAVHEHKVGNAVVQWEDGVFFAGEMTPMRFVPGYDLPNRDASGVGELSASGQKRITG